ncbi:hypothetical protein [Desmospora profundinema]|uniref:Uncharacterized protein n=1 Tax=Desmospora profundinema TaxID=1571184 RepID=A0ABU1IR82_9BACL|nr:hypothetical protein [Desmospora profundinema]MDR6227307.1 hypothetical protein [Desmospora profundinema]
MKWIVKDAFVFVLTIEQDKLLYIVSMAIGGRMAAGKLRKWNIFETIIPYGDFLKQSHEW